MALKVKGWRKDSTLIIGEDSHAYNVEKKIKNILYLSCYVKTCSARATVKILEDEEEDNLGPVEMSKRENRGTHDHDADLEFQEVIVLRKTILDRCRKETTSFKSIFMEETNK